MTSVLSTTASYESVTIYQAATDPWSEDVINGPVRNLANRDHSLSVVAASNSTLVSTETSTRASAVTSLTTRVSTEESTRASAVTSLTTRMSNEESLRGSVDSDLNYYLTSIVDGSPVINWTTGETNVVRSLMSALNAKGIISGVES